VFGLFRFVEKCYELFSSDFEEEFVVDRERNRETLEGLAIPLAIRSGEGYGRYGFYYLFAVGACCIQYNTVTFWTLAR
jgi:hypothetical protein